MGAGGLSNFWDSGLTLHGLVGETDPGDSCGRLVRRTRSAQGQRAILARSAVLGRSISASAIIRTLVRRVDKHRSWATDVLFLEIEKELQEGVMWGKKK